MRLALGLVVAFLLAENAFGQNPLSILGKVVTTSMDVRTKAEVTADTEIGAGASKRLLDDKKAEWAGVTVMGVAQSQQESNLALQKIRGIKGVRDVKARLRIVPAKK